MRDREHANLWGMIRPLLLSPSGHRSPAGSPDGGGGGRPAVFRCGGRMDRCVGAAARLPGGDRKNLAIQALSRSETVSDLAARHGVSRKFVYQQTHKAGAVLADAFLPATPDNKGLS